MVPSPESAQEQDREPAEPEREREPRRANEVARESAALLGDPGVELATEAAHGPDHEPDREPEDAVCPDNS